MRKPILALSVFCASVSLISRTAAVEEDYGITLSRCHGIKPSLGYDDGSPKLVCKKLEVNIGHSLTCTDVRLEFADYLVCAGQVKFTGAGEDPMQEMYFKGGVYIMKPDRSVIEGEEIVFDDVMKKAFVDAGERYQYQK
jgi:hypothetical protein